MYFNSKGQEEVSYDAIVIGSGISGGWAAKELCEKGLKTLVLEKGRMVKHGDYPTALKEDWEFENRGQLSAEELTQYEKQNRTGYTMHQSSKHWWVNDLEHPYTETKRFDWIRGHHVGGRSLMWGRQSWRLSELDFEANLREGIAVDWPIRYADLAPWYEHVEKFIGVQGENVGLPQLPDSNLLPAMELTCVEEHFRDSIKSNFGRTLTVGRSANLSQAHNGRGACQYRNRCIRGCPYGAYFSSNASTLPAAEATGNMTLRPNSVVHSIIYDPATRKAKGVKVIDAETMETTEFYAKIIFCCASALSTTLILFNSANEDFPNGLGNSSGQLGHNVMDHHFRAGATGIYEGFGDKFHKGRRPTGVYLARYRNVDKASESKDYLRGWGYQGGASRTNWMQGVKELDMTLGAEFKSKLIIPGPWQMGLNAFAECLPYYDNKVTLNTDVLDKYGLPTLTMDCEFKENEMNMRKDMANDAAEMLEAAGFTNVETYDAGSWPGLGIHEMGTARMGRTPKSSVLNGWNQMWDVPNVFVTDGSCMTSAACQNPSLTYMALTARAANYAVEELKKMNL
ncbi:MAG TPA: GMC family oxidoreductase [Saprospiraceae bacterium]|nr:GMC family oxidoreductase [Saprospiraceae bacterium]HMQ84098.1 GMC family oxidoreductase [Saprospiraceae bacterium]